MRVVRWSLLLLPLFALNLVAAEPTAVSVAALVQEADEGALAAPLTEACSRRLRSCALPRRG